MAMRITMEMVMAVPLAAAQDAWIGVRGEHGLSLKAVPLLTEGNMKLLKSNLQTYGLTLAAHSGSGWNVCGSSTPLCRKGCLQYSGHQGMPHAQAVQIARTQFLAEHTLHFLRLLVHELQRLQVKHPDGFAMRLNVLSDLRWEEIFPDLFALDGIQFYDYTKHRDRVDLPANYHLSLSISERDDIFDVAEIANSGGLPVVVLDTRKDEPLPETIAGFPVVDGDESDERFLDPQGGVIVALRAKGPMRKADQFDGFVKQADAFGGNLNLTA